MLPSLRYNSLLPRPPAVCYDDTMMTHRVSFHFAKLSDKGTSELKLEARIVWIDTDACRASDTLNQLQITGTMR
jgi:hypothetical protein